MARTTGIELGPDSCVLVGVRAGRGTANLFALHTIEPGAWPAHDVALATALRDARRKNRLPRRARVVAWGLPQSASPDDPMTRAALRPLLSAGFKIDSVLHPPEALAALASLRPRTADGTAVAWLALNMHGAAIAIVAHGELLFSRTFDWRYQHGITAPKAQMLQRYSLVSQLAPELRRGIESVRASRGIRVDTAVTCGDLPDLRSLTMPLIEELDLEVETLDSLEGLRLTGRARNDRLVEAVPALRLACAAAVTPDTRRGRSLTPLLRAAAAVLIVSGVGWLGYAWWMGPGVRPANTATAPQQQARTEPMPQARATPSQQPRTAPPPPTGDAIPQTRAATPTVPNVPRATPTSTAPVSQIRPLPPPVVKDTQPVSAPVAQTKVPPASTQPKQVPPPAAPPKSVTATPNRNTAPPPVTRSVTPTPSGTRKPAPPSSVPSTPAPPPPATSAPPATPPRPTPEIPGSTIPQATPTGTVALAPIIPAPPVSSSTVSPAATEKRASDRTPAADVTQPPPRRRLTPLKDPLPRIDSILIDRERRLAVVNGEIVGVGDAVGPRVVHQIEREAVVFREPSGFDVRVPLRTRD